jgi:hypothetical protein
MDQHGVEIRLRKAGESQSIWQLETYFQIVFLYFLARYLRDRPSVGKTLGLTFTTDGGMGSKGPVCSVEVGIFPFNFQTL